MTVLYLTVPVPLAYTLAPMIDALELLGGFYATIAAWLLLSAVGERIAEWLERRSIGGHRA